MPPPMAAIWQTPNAPGFHRVGAGGSLTHVTLPYPPLIHARRVLTVYRAPAAPRLLVEPLPAREFRGPTSAFAHRRCRRARPCLPDGRAKHAPGLTGPVRPQSPGCEPTGSSPPIGQLRARVTATKRTANSSNARPPAPLADGLDDQPRHDGRSALHGGVEEPPVPGNQPSA